MAVTRLGPLKRAFPTSCLGQSRTIAAAVPRRESTGTAPSIRDRLPSRPSAMARHLDRPPIGRGRGDGWHREICHRSDIATARARPHRPRSPIAVPSVAPPARPPDPSESVRVGLPCRTDSWRGRCGGTRAGRDPLRPASGPAFFPTNRPPSSRLPAGRTRAPVRVSVRVNKSLEGLDWASECVSICSYFDSTEFRRKVSCTTAVPRRLDVPLVARPPPPGRLSRERPPPLR